MQLEAERGYATSGVIDHLMFWEDNSQENMENYETGNGWTSGSNHFWDREQHISTDLTPG